VHMKILQEMGIPNKIVSVVLPLGYTFNQDGSILYQTLARDVHGGGPTMSRSAGRNC